MISPSRRHVLAAGLGLAATGALGFPRIARAAAPFTQPPLPYAEDALAPGISARTVALHYGRHHASYYKNLNEAVVGTPFAEMSLEQVVTETSGSEQHQKVFNNAGQAWNHVLYWDQMKPGGAREPSGPLAERMESVFGGFPSFKEQFVQKAGDNFGSGWTWLVRDPENGLAIMNTGNADNPLAHGMTALMGVDVWEHAYYLDYQNRRTAHVTAVLDTLIDWNYPASRLPA